MAQRYGGKYSPEGSQDGYDGAKNPFEGARRTRAGGRVNLLFLAPFPLIWKAFTAEPVVMAQYLAAFGVLILAAWLTREGIKAHEAFDARKVARPPAVPRKMLASFLTGAGLGLAGIAEHGPLDAVIFGVIGLALHLFAFGLDPLKGKGVEGIDQFQSDRVARAVDEAERHLDAMSDAILRAKDRGLERRVEEFKSQAREMFRTVEDDPRDLTAARKYLGVYLLGAKDATVKFADLYATTRDGQAKNDYEALLSDLESNFAAKTRQFLDDNRTDLDVEIEVLRERLQRDGLRAE